ncbi:uncharacterized protein LOC9635487 [Selaginella moellendorffii]|uniref:uncharacterized protein LOC9635487 n=1 Tax=Selaginella moellendorffii TaxID=88036 RepID=UPI000D1CB091|nr:uncharacterized protein LOC9635487 [Selaginella moellendorffii]|eukprot:XP_024520746.1 uncharacterized protein LOC9635487 [Selaginella moellendorffii]
MEEGVFRILDGSSIREALLGSQLPDRVRRRFQRLVKAADGSPSSSSVDARIAAEEEAAALLLGSELCGRQLVVTAAASRLPDPNTLLDAAAFEASLRSYLEAVADALQEKPIVVSVLDGSAFKGLLEDEDEFAMVAENVFDELDADNSGKLNRSELRSAVLQLVAAVGCPNPSAKPDVEDLLTKLLSKYASQDSKELGQTQFAKLLQDVLQDLSETLASQPIVVVRDVKVLDGSNLRKVLHDEELFSDMAKDTFKELDSDKDGKLSKSEIRPVFESRAAQWGLPPLDEDSADELYAQIFKEIDADSSGDVDEREFQSLMRALIESFAAQLKMNPILVDVETAVQ